MWIDHLLFIEIASNYSFFFFKFLILEVLVMILLIFQESKELEALNFEISKNQ